MTAVLRTSGIFVVLVIFVLLFLAFLPFLVILGSNYNIYVYCVGCLEALLFCIEQISCRSRYACCRCFASVATRCQFLDVPLVILFWTYLGIPLDNPCWVLYMSSIFNLIHPCPADMPTWSLSMLLEIWLVNILSLYSPRA